MENFGIINVWIEHYYFSTGTSETGFFSSSIVSDENLGQNVLFQNGPRDFFC